MNITSLVLGQDDLNNLNHISGYVSGTDSGTYTVWLNGVKILDRYLTLGADLWTYDVPGTGMQTFCAMKDVTNQVCKGIYVDNPLPQKYGCMDGCTNTTAAGQYDTKAACLAACPGPSLYECQNGNCVATWSGTATNAQCEAVCWVTVGFTIKADKTSGSSGYVSNVTITKTDGIFPLSSLSLVYYTTGFFDMGVTCIQTNIQLDANNQAVIPVQVTKDMTVLAIDGIGSCTLQEPLTRQTSNEIVMSITPWTTYALYAGVSIAAIIFINDFMKNRKARTGTVKKVYQRARRTITPRSTDIVYDVRGRRCR